MRVVLRAFLALVFLAAAVPEIGRYAAERRMRQMDEAINAAQLDPRFVSVRGRILQRVADDAMKLDIPGDWRPMNIAASALFASGRPDRAAAAFSRASRIGERPELSMNLGIALDAAGLPEEAVAAMVRAVWVSPALLTRSGVHRAEVERRIAELDARLRRGAFKPSDLPPLPVVRE